VIANLAVYFGLHVLFDEVKPQHWALLHFDSPDLGSFDPLAAAIAALAGVLIFRQKWSVLRVLGVCAVVGGVLHIVA
jgi:chromate transporter